MELKFPELRGGPVQGLNDAGVENFQGNIELFLSRECGQNTADAPGKNASSVRLEFERLTLEAKDIPGFSQLRETLRLCRDYERWRGKDKEREFFDQALALAARREIPVLKISDFSTTGLTGSDERGRWWALVKSQGVSDKGDTSGGSFGIGKSSPFAASRFRTVFYGTRTESGQVAFQGVSRLVTHADAKGKPTQAVGFIGDYDPNGGEGGEPVFRAVRSEGSIPELFRRVAPGTDIWVVGYKGGLEWSKNLVRSILENFWPAIYQGTIQFKVGRQEIEKQNLEELIKEHIGEEDFQAHHFYKAILREPITKRLEYVGDCALYLTTESPDLPRQICMVRKTGMRIYDYPPRSARVPFSGLFLCTDPEGNKLLRQMEPPRHDVWDPKRIEGPQGRMVLSEIKGWIKAEVKKLNPLYSGKSFNEDELAKYLPDEDVDVLPQDDTGKSREESLEPKPMKTEVLLKPIVMKPAVPATVEGSGSQGGFDHDEGNSGDQRGPGSGEGGRGGAGDGEAPTRASKPPRISVRSYRSGLNEYQLLLRSPERFSGAMSVFAVGEDGEHEPIDVADARLGNTGRKLILKGGAIHGIQIKPTQPLRIIVKVTELERRSLTAVAQS